MRSCEYCGYILDEEERSCPHCGAVVRVEISVEDDSEEDRIWDVSQEIEEKRLENNKRYIEKKKEIGLGVTKEEKLSSSLFGNSDDKNLSFEHVLVVGIIFLIVFVPFVYPRVLEGFGRGPIESGDDIPSEPNSEINPSYFVKLEILLDNGGYWQNYTVDNTTYINYYDNYTKYEGEIWVYINNKSIPLDKTYVYNGVYISEIKFEVERFDIKIFHGNESYWWGFNVYLYSGELYQNTLIMNVGE